VLASVADPGFLSRIPDPDLFQTRIPDSTTATTEKRENLSSFLFCSHKYHKIENYFIFEQIKTKI
jgi:hypothetical protein